VGSATKIFEGLGPSTLIPQRGKVSPRELATLGAEEGFVLSRVDGHTTLEEICLLVPIDPPVTQVILRRLAEIGAIEVPGVPRTLPRISASMPVTTEEPAVQAMDDAHRKRIDHFFSGLETRNAFELLEIEQSADAREVKRAYFRLSKEFHPDRYFGKDIGDDYKEKLNRIFQAVKAAFELLSDKERRKAYEESAGLTK
jgi:hypothetical protein